MPVFHYFSRLPPELRHHIWQFALEHWSVITASANRRSYELQPIGWDKCVVGRVCLEARTIMEKTCEPYAPGSTAWINLQSTVLFLGGAAKASRTIGLLDPRLCFNMTHVVIIWTTWPEVVGCIKQMSERCHSLMSILIFDAGKPVTHDVRPLAPQDVERMTTAFRLRWKPKYEPWWLDGDALIVDLQGVDFIVTLDGPKDIKPVLLKLKNSPFVEKAQWFYYRTPAGDMIQIDFVAQWQAPYFPSAAQKIKDIPEGTLPLISAEDLVLSKMCSCGLPGAQDKKAQDAMDAMVLLEALTQKVPSLKLSSAKIEIAKQGLADVIALSDKNEAWWRSKLGLPKSPSPSPSRVVPNASSTSRGDSSAQRGSPKGSSGKGPARKYY